MVHQPPNIWTNGNRSRDLACISNLRHLPRSSTLVVHLCLIKPTQIGDTVHGKGQIPAQESGLLDYCEVSRVSRSVAQLLTKKKRVELYIIIYFSSQLRRLMMRHNHVWGKIMLPSVSDEWESQIAKKDWRRSGKWQIYKFLWGQSATLGRREWAFLRNATVQLTFCSLLKLNIFSR